jgi:isoleucyl-tRNA synthetase
MKFKAGQRRKAIEYEKDLVRQWKKNKTFEKSIEQRPKDNGYIFYDGPPFITGVPHHGTLLSSIAKDVVPRYWTMKGRRVERLWGWDCHGLPAEVFTEKKLGIRDRRDIGTKISLQEYITTCRDNMVQTGSLWEDTIDRVGRWVNFKGAYRTMDKDYMESVWWAFKQLYDKGKIYEGEKVLLYCTRDATPISKAEVAMDNNYQDDTDPSIFAKFKLRGEENVYLLVWTTVPWTTIANTALAVDKDADYSEVQLEDGSQVILATELLERALTDEKHKQVPFTLVHSLKGSDLVGRQYEPISVDRGEGAHKVHHADFVTMEEGTGIVSIAPAYGEEDYALAKQVGAPIVSVVDDNGLLTESEFAGELVWEANKAIAKKWRDEGKVWKIEYVTHSYPHCHRCQSKLIYRAHPSWFVDIDGQRQLMLDENEHVSWYPKHLKEGRFRKTVESAPDWNISRDRFWATAMPIWKGTKRDGSEVIRVVGSYAELKELSGVELEDYHRPWVDDIEFDIDGVHYKRIDKVLDCWFESGSMPFAQFHYPFENVEKFEANYPGDYIVEYVGQVRAWFYYVHAVNVALFGRYAFKHVNVTGNLAGNDGRKMSKSYGNYTDPNELMDLYSADALRFLLMGSPLMNGEDFALQDKEVQDVQRKLAMIWNMYDFFTLYASVDGWEWDGNTDDPSTALQHPLDKWVLSRLHQLQVHIEKHMDTYDIPGALEPVLAFVDDASNWYVRRSRRRFWKSGDDADKNDAYRTLHYVLVKLSVILAPFVPFLAEELYQKLTGGDSVHLLDWPKPGVIDEKALEQMAFVRDVINEGLSQRAAHKLKVRQPLKKVSVPDVGGFLAKNPALVEIVLEELNVKEVVDTSDVITLDLDVTPGLRREGIMRELVRQVQTARKAAGLNVDDRIQLQLSTQDEEVLQAINEHAEVIKTETLATSLNEGTVSSYATNAVVDGFSVSIVLAKA